MKDSVTTCPNDAAIRYIWPGKDEAFCCMEHAVGISNVAQAMGCPVHMHPITPDFAKEGWPKCSSHVKEQTNVEA